MEDDGTVNEMIDDIIDGVFNDALRASIKNPAKAAFFIKVILAQRKAAKVRAKNEEDGTHVPPVMILSVTNMCNLHCIGCYSQIIENEQKPELDEAGLRNVLHQASELGISIVLLVGGEPLTRSEIFKITKDFPEIIFPLFTNGTLIDDFIVQQFAEQKNVIPILSMEGHEETTDLRRGTGIYDGLMKAMAKLNERNVFFGLSFTVTRSNFDVVTDDGFIHSMREHGSKAFIFVEYNPVKEGTEGWVITAEQREGLLEKIVSYHNSRSGVYVGFPGVEKVFGGCLSAGRGFIYVTASGSLEPCPFAPYSDSNILDMTLKEALNSKLLKTIRENRDQLMESDGGCALWKKRPWVTSLLRKI
jgi:MoaA/NifB/PqqE/SkfB family radical SAM enzyme